MERKILESDLHATRLSRSIVSYSIRRKMDCIQLVHSRGMSCSALHFGLPWLHQDFTPSQVNVWTTHGSCPYRSLSTGVPVDSSAIDRSLVGDIKARAEWQRICAGFWLSLDKQVTVGRGKGGMRVWSPGIERQGTRSGRDFEDRVDGCNLEPCDRLQ